MQAEEILQAARVLCNDAGISLAGQVLADAQPYVFTELEFCYEQMQDDLIDEGVATFTSEQIVTGLGAVTTTDPTTQVSLAYNGYFDGTTLNATPYLPPNILMVLEVWERQTGVSSAPFTSVRPVSDSISTRPQQAVFGVYDYRGDALYFPGAVLSRDIKIKGIIYAPELTGPNSPVLIMRCKPALALLMAAWAAEARGGNKAAATFREQYQEAVAKIVNRSVQKNQYTKYVRRPFRGRGRSRYGYR